MSPVPAQSKDAASRGPHFSRPLVISGPSGTGKSTLLKRLFEEFKGEFGFSVSHTTRNPRRGETDGKDYHFTHREDFLALLSKGHFIEHAEFSGNLYGTSFEAVKKVHDEGKRCILDIEAQGVRQIKTTSLNPVYLFISPPSMEVLSTRLRNRGTDTPEAIQKRLNTALEEMKYARKGVHDFVIVNNSLDIAYAKFKEVARGNVIISDSLPSCSDTGESASS